MELKQSKLKDFLSQRQSSGMYKASIIRRFEEMFELYPGLTMGELLFYVLKSTGDISNPLQWTDGNFLKRVESVQKQLIECYDSETGTFSKNDESLTEEYLTERASKYPQIYGK